MHSQRPGSMVSNQAGPGEPAFLRALAIIRRYGVAIILGYFPTAAAYGLLARQSGLSVAEAVFLSVWVFAGASQFLVVDLVAAGVAWPVWVLTGAFMNLRHALFAVSMAPRWAGWSRGRRVVASFCLTDEVFAVAASEGPVFDGSLETVALGATAYLSWVAGSLLGAWGSVAFPPALAEPLGFALPALFLALLVPALRDRPGVAAALVGGGVSLWVTAAGHTSWGIVLGGLLGAMAGGWAATATQRRSGVGTQEGESHGT